MTIALIAGGLAFAVGLLVLRPLPARGRPPAPEPVPDDARRRELLRQLRDLDDDLAAGKLTEDDHTRLRGPVEQEAAAVLGRQPSRPAGQAGAPGAGAPGTGTLLAAPPPGAAGPPPRGQGSRPRWRRPAAVVLSLAGASAAVVALLLGAISARSPGQNITGSAVPGAAGPASPAAATASSGPASGAPASAPPAPATSAPVPSASAPAPSASPSPPPPTQQQLAAVTAAEAQVKQNPRSVTAHLALAGAYAAAGSTQLATVEYLTVTQLDPANPEAGTALALLAFEVGRPAQARTMIDKVLAADAKYPEALYVRGLVDLMGLRQAKAAERDFNAYLAAAPFGSHRAAASTLLALAQSQGQGQR